jgi:hypothetical protein
MYREKSVKEKFKLLLKAVESLPMFQMKNYLKELEKE